KEHQIDTPIDQMPIFIKAGTVLPEYPVMQFVNQKTIEVLDVNVFYSDTNIESSLYEDQGDSYDYQQNVRLEKKFNVKGTPSSLEIKQEVEGLYTESYNKYNLKIIGLPFNVESVFLDNEETNFKQDESGNYLVSVGKRFKTIMLK